MRLIDADALLEEWAEDASAKQQDLSVRFAATVIRKELLNAPTVNMAEAERDVELLKGVIYSLRAHADDGTMDCSYCRAVLRQHDEWMRGRR